VLLEGHPCEIVAKARIATKDDGLDIPLDLSAASIVEGRKSSAVRSSLAWAARNVKGVEILTQ
jgi:hypothetical protein